MTNSTNSPPPREELATRKADAERSDKLGVVIGGSLSEGLAVKLDRDISLEELAVGRYVVARGRRARFFCMITDVALDSTNPLIAKQPPDMSDPFLAAVHQGTTTFGTVHLSPLLILEDGKDEPKPVKTVPEHFAPVSTASQAEVDQVFGEEGVRQVGGKTSAPLPHRRAAGHGERQDHPEPGAAGRAVERRLRQVGHGQDLPLAAAAGRRDPTAGGGQPDLRHAQRVRLGRDKRGIGWAGKRAKSVISRPGGHLHTRRRLKPKTRSEVRTTRSQSATIKSSRKTWRCSPAS